MNKDEKKLIKKTIQDSCFNFVGEYVQVGVYDMKSGLPKMIYIECVLKACSYDLIKIEFCHTITFIKKSDIQCIKRI